MNIVTNHSKFNISRHRVNFPLSYSQSLRLPVFSLGEQALVGRADGTPQAQLFSFTISTFYVILFVFNNSIIQILFDEF